MYNYIQSKDKTYINIWCKFLLTHSVYVQTAELCRTLWQPQGLMAENTIMSDIKQYFISKSVNEFDWLVKLIKWTERQNEEYTWYGTQYGIPKRKCSFGKLIDWILGYEAIFRTILDWLFHQSLEGQNIFFIAHHMYHLGVSPFDGLISHCHIS